MMDGKSKRYAPAINVIENEKDYKVELVSSGNDQELILR